VAGNALLKRTAPSALTTAAAASWIVATSPAQAERLRAIAQQAAANGVNELLASRHGEALALSRS
jgi:hypothetical protein